MDKELLTAEQAAARLGVAYTSFSRWIRQGRVPGAFRVGRGWLVPADCLDNIERPTRGRPWPKSDDDDRA